MTHTETTLKNGVTTVTDGNNSFVYLWDKDIYPKDNIGSFRSELFVLSSIASFESMFPELEVLEYQVQTIESGGRYHGIWIRHKPKTATGVVRSRSNVASPHDIGSDAG